MFYTYTHTNTHTMTKYLKNKAINNKYEIKFIEYEKLDNDKCERVREREVFNEQTSI